MNIIPIHYKPSKPVTEWKQIADEAYNVVEWLEKTNGKFPGDHKRAIAIAHNQVSEDPYAFFVVDKAVLKMGFPHQIIVNARIVQANDVRMRGEDAISNIYRPNEGCMSFPHRDVKHVERFYEITVEFEIPSGIWPFTKLKTVRQTYQGLPAEVFQHEIDHAKGKNIYFSEPPINQ